MDTRECDAQMNADYDEVLKRFGSEAMVKKFALKFLNDPSYKDLTEAIAANNGEEAFRASAQISDSARFMPFPQSLQRS